MAATPLKRIRVEDDLWEAFGDAATTFGSDRTKLLVGFMRRLVASLEPGHPPNSRSDHGIPPTDSGA